MQCRTCGTEIADKAIICFRCGAGTTDPVRKAAPIRSPRSSLVPLVLMITLIVVAIYLGQASRTAASPDTYKLAAGLCLGAAVALLVVRVARRR